MNTLVLKPNASQTSDRVPLVTLPRICVTGAALLMAWAATGAPLPPTNKAMLSDPFARVVSVNLSRMSSYTIYGGANGSIWVALDPVMIVAGADHDQAARQVKSGDAEEVAPGNHVQFHAKGGVSARLVVVQAKKPHQELTIAHFEITGTFEDATARNRTLLVALSPARIRDTRNLGDEIAVDSE